jgi:RecA/RadA recombinase
MATVEVRDDKGKALNVAIAQIERAYGKGSIMRMGADGAKMVIEAISTGALNLDAAIGIGGIPRGRMTEIYGPESSGKTTLCLHVIANAQRNGGGPAPAAGPDVSARLAVRPTVVEHDGARFDVGEQIVVVREAPVGVNLRVVEDRGRLETLHLVQDVVVEDVRIGEIALTVTHAGPSRSPNQSLASRLRFPMYVTEFIRRAVARSRPRSSRAPFD